MHSSEITITSKFLVTGGYGFLAKKLVDKLTGRGDDVIVVCRDRQKASETYEGNERVKVVTGDLIQYSTNEELLKENINGIYHLSAYRDVMSCEKNPIEAVKSNIISTLNVLDLSVRCGAKFVVGASTFAADKPTGAYGATKLLTEKLFAQFQEINQQANYGVLRFGPLLYCPNSVLDNWKKALDKKEKIVLTSPSATRKFVSVDSVVEEMLKNPKGIEEFNTKSIRLADLLKAFVEKYSDDPDSVEKEVTGLREGEQLESGNSDELMSIEDIKQII
jgi:UDP-N-acetylglucosamine 4,6-dehydratase/UDP-glucose 4-epimerase